MTSYAIFYNLVCNYVSLFSKKVKTESQNWKQASRISLDQFCHGNSTAAATTKLGFDEILFKVDMSKQAAIARL